MNQNELVNLHHCIYFTKENELDVIFKYHDPILVSAGYLSCLDEKGNTQLQLYVYVNNEWIAVTDQRRVKSLNEEYLIEAVFYLLQEITSQRKEIECLKSKINQPKILRF